MRSQVDGKLLSVNYTEGQQVERGYVLAQIDPTTYQAAYDQAVAKKALDEATLANARLDLERYNKLVASNSIARQQLDTQKMTVAQQEAQVKLDQAQIDNAKAILDYTQIIAPIPSAPASARSHQGNIVHASDANGIVVITQLQPLGAVSPCRSSSSATSIVRSRRGRCRWMFALRDIKTVAETGELKVVDNQVDPSTGTIKSRPNCHRELQLWPGGLSTAAADPHARRCGRRLRRAAGRAAHSSMWQLTGSGAAGDGAVTRRDQAVIAKGLKLMSADHWLRPTAAAAWPACRIAPPPGAQPPAAAPARAAPRSAFRGYPCASPSTQQ